MNGTQYLLYFPKPCCTLSFSIFYNHQCHIGIDHISLLNVQTNYYNNNLLILDVKQLNKIMKFYYLYTLKALWNDQGKFKMYYGMSWVKKQLSGKRSINVNY